jgi:hypothetical protein
MVAPMGAVGGLIVVRVGACAQILPIEDNNKTKPLFLVNIEIPLLSMTEA